MKHSESPLKKIFELTQHEWDHPAERAAVRDNFRKVCACRTPALGGEVYASAAGEKVFHHTCKSKCCPSCGNRATLLWLEEQWAALPDISFVGIVLTMPTVFWPVFKAHRHLQHDLPALGAAVLQQWAWNLYQVRLHIIVIQHTFGGRLNHFPHLHMMVSAGGLKPGEARWVEPLEFDREQIMILWRFALTSYLWKANRDGLLRKSSLPGEFNDLIYEEAQRDYWHIHLTARMSKRHFLGYAGRYIRRLPIAQNRILTVTEDEVVYLAKDTRTKTFRETSCTPAEFVAMLSPHVLDRYQHSMRYYGLLAPRTKTLTSAAVFALLGLHQRPKPPRQGWADSLKQHFGVDPLIDEFGNPMQWVGRRQPVPVRALPRVGQ
jgi:Putative transposase/Transposase zinc-binding domain